MGRNFSTSIRQIRSSYDTLPNGILDGNYRLCGYSYIMPARRSTGSNRSLTCVASPPTTGHRLDHLFEPDRGRCEAVVVDETKLKIEDEAVYVWASVDVDTFEALDVDVSPCRSLDFLETEPRRETWGDRSLIEAQFGRSVTRDRPQRPLRTVPRCTCGRTPRVICRLLRPPPRGVRCWKSRRSEPSRSRCAGARRS